mmetsp:Transcript_22445/g.75791  ORF Transcript_22445/g.75791 Transcript_22445/m.75791 type:complete len:277 (-) Transcript_22445:204-1034(-)
MSRSQLTTKEGKKQAAAAAKRHDELVKKAERALKTKAVNHKETARGLLQAAIKEQRAPATILLLATLQYDMNRFADAATSAELVLRSGPGASQQRDAEALLARIGGSRKSKEPQTPTSAIDGLLDSVLGGSTPQRRFASDPWAPSTDLPPSQPSTEALSSVDALFGGASARTPPQQRSNPFGDEESCGSAAANPFGGESDPTPFDDEEGSEWEGGEVTTLALRPGDDAGEEHIEDPLEVALSSLSKIATRVEELALAGPESEGELLQLVRALAKLH